MPTPIHQLLRRAFEKELILDLEDRVRAEAVKAFEMVRDRSGLDKKRARELEGQARFRMMEQGFQEVCALHNGKLLDGGIIPNTELKVFQPFMRFEVDGRGVILGLAAMPDRKVVPIKNMSRLAGVSINYSLSPRLDFGGSGPKVGDVFALLLISRNREKAGLLDEIAVGVIDSGYTSFLIYEPVETFLAVHTGAQTEKPAALPVAERPKSSVTLRKDVKPFVPPEAPARKGADKKSG
ncbi:hypothetical protein [Methylobacterium sp.]|uniref:hypothetical protein n=1 Tax=Methylobacterium sp. TaxID=409 RepID=UPI0026175486|nr:hypothetical protein [Methylobacterium sp.]MDB5645788.1 hypothetical protein [Methylobacterium sp.]